MIDMKNWYDLYYDGDLDFMDGYDWNILYFEYHNWCVLNNYEAID